MDTLLSEIIAVKAFCTIVGEVYAYEVKAVGGVRATYSVSWLREMMRDGRIMAANLSLDSGKIVPIKEIYGHATVMQDV